MGLFWDLLQQSQISDHSERAASLEHRVARLVAELQRTQRLLREVIGRLEDLPHLEDLALHGTSISVRGLERFRACTNLKGLTTRRNMGFGEADVRNLIAGIPRCEWDGRLG